jgi:hypothetical protein
MEMWQGQWPGTRFRRLRTTRRSYGRFDAISQTPIGITTLATNYHVKADLSTSHSPGEINLSSIPNRSGWA